MKETTDLTLSYSRGPDHSHSAPPPPHLSAALPLSLSVFCGDYLFVEDAAVGSRCLTQQSGCLVTWLYNCFPELVVLHPTKTLKGCCSFFSLESVLYSHSDFFWRNASLYLHGIWWRIKREFHIAFCPPMFECSMNVLHCIVCLFSSQLRLECLCSVYVSVGRRKPVSIYLWMVVSMHVAKKKEIIRGEYSKSCSL